MKIIVPNKNEHMQQFLKIDKTSRGKIRLEEIVDGIKPEIVSNVTTESLTKYFPHVDQNQDNYLDSDDFVRLIYICQNMEQDEADDYTLYFLATDSDCSGTIDRSEIKQLIQDCFPEIPQKKIDQQIFQHFGAEYASAR